MAKEVALKKIQQELLPYQFTAFEIVGKNLVSSWKGDDVEFNLEREWAREECERRYGLSFRYDGKTANAIRAGILHYRTERLSNEEAEKLVNTYANDFGRDVSQNVAKEASPFRAERLV